MGEVVPSVPGRWSAKQDEVLVGLSRWMRDSSASQVKRLFGYAGVGKTTLVRELVAAAGKPWLYAAYTGKAASVMRQKGCEGAQTIHSLIYRPDGRSTPASPGEKRRLAFRLWDESPLRWAPGVVVDECSMVDEDVGRDLLSFGKKVLVCGDPAQLPPVGGGGFFTSGEPDYFLDEVHRQARESGILDLATHVREGGALAGRIGWSTEDCAVVARDRTRGAQIWRRMVDADQVIVGTNRTRHEFNRRRRLLSGVDGPLPVAGDKLICLRNERSVGLWNGSLWRCRGAVPHEGQDTVALEIADDDTGRELDVCSWTHHFLGREAELEERPRMWHHEFDFGWNITCHKSQGSQWDDVVLFDESGVFGEDTARRWLYTGITRAARRLLVVA